MGTPSPAGGRGSCSRRRRCRLLRPAAAAASRTLMPLRLVLPLLGTTALVASFVLPPLPGRAGAAWSCRRRQESTLVARATPKEDMLAQWSLGEAVDEELLELARKEALATDADWYRTVIGAAPDAQEEAAAGAGPATTATTAAAAPSATAAPSPAVEVLDPAVRKLLALGYSEEETRGLPCDIASVIVESGIRRPEGPLPPEWLSEEGAVDARAEYGVGEEGQKEYNAPPPRPRQRAAGVGRGRDVAAAASTSPSPARRRRDRSSGSGSGSGSGSRRAGSRRAAYRRDAEEEDGEEEDPFLEEDEEDLDEEERAYRRGLQAPLYRPRPGFDDDDDDFGPTFTEQEPGLLPLLLDQVTAKIRASPVLRPLLREDRFKYLLSQEADLRLLVTGSWAADMLRDEYRWRLGLFRDYLKVEGKPDGGKGRRRGGGGSRSRRPAYDDEEEDEDGMRYDDDEDGDDFYFDRGDGQWHRTEAGEARRRARRGRYWAEDEDDEDEDTDDYVVRRRGKGNRPDFDWEGGGAAAPVGVRGRRPGRVGRRGRSARRGWDEEEEDGVLDASWAPYDEEESSRGGGRRRPPSSSSSSSYRQPSHRRPEEEVEELVDRRFMGLEEEESTNDRSAAWIWYSPGSGGAARGGRQEEDEDAGEGAGTKQKEGKGRGGKKTKKEEKKAASSSGGFRWPWSRSKDEGEDE